MPEFDFAAELEDDDPLIDGARGAARLAPEADAIELAATPLWRRRAYWIAIALLLGAIVVLLTAGRGYKSSIIRTLFPTARFALLQPTVTAVTPADKSGFVSPDAHVAVEVALPNGGRVIDAGTVSADSVRLRRGDGVPVAARVNTTAAGDAVVLQPDVPLDPNTHYYFEILPALRDTAGASFKYFSTSFTTSAGGAATAYPAAFDKVPQDAAVGQRYTGVTVGPDGRLYACTLDGLIQRFDLAPDGTLGWPTTIRTVQQANGGLRIITGICFDPAATADAPLLWVSHGHAGHSGAPDWTGKISRLSGVDLAHYEDVVVGLPRSARDHLNNQPTFGPDGALYFCTGSNTAMGAADSAWTYRPERLLSAAVLRLDVRAVAQLPLNVQTAEGNNYDPFGPAAPLTIYATGVRNAFDLLWHSNGQLYAPVNGSAAGGNVPATPKAGTPTTRRLNRATTPTPSAPGLEDVRYTEPDVLARIVPGRYFGHPNPARGEYVLNGGNPTAGQDPAEIAQYPVGTAPDRNYCPPAHTFGKNLSPCGLIEYRDRTGGPLDGKLFVTRYSGGKDIVVLTVGPDGRVTESLTGIAGLTGFAEPIDLAQSPTTGHLYVVEFGGKRITLVRAIPSGTSERVFRETPHAAVE